MFECALLFFRLFCVAPLSFLVMHYRSELGLKAAFHPRFVWIGLSRKGNAGLRDVFFE